MPRVKLELVAQRRELPTADGDRNAYGSDTAAVLHVHNIIYAFSVSAMYNIIYIIPLTGFDDYCQCLVLRISPCWGHAQIVIYTRTLHFLSNARAHTLTPHTVISRINSTNYNNKSSEKNTESSSFGNGLPSQHELRQYNILLHYNLWNLLST